MHITLDIAPIIFYLAGISALLSAIFILWNYLNRRTIRKNIEANELLPRLQKDSPRDISQGVTVVVYAENNTASLAENLPHILNQDYPLYEVIVVNDGANEDTHDLLKRMSYDYTHLHYTFTPDDAHCVSRKKLSLMIGIKAAKYDTIITTNAYCVPQSRHWVSSVARHFASGAKVVIGHSHYPEDCDTSRGAKLRAFIMQQTAVKYLIQALRHKPYRGVSDNLAFSKELFFANKGFSHSMHLHNGEDDIFINEIATHDNTHVELSPESIMLVKRMFSSNHIKDELKLRAFTERKIHSTAHLFAALRSGIYIVDLCIIASIIFADIAIYHNLSISCIALVLLLLLTIPLMVNYRKTATLLQFRKLSLLVPFFSLIQPLANLVINIKSRIHSTSFYTWQPLKK